MSVKSSAKTALYALGLTLWVMVSFLVGQTIAALLVGKVSTGLNPAVEVTIMAALGYILALAITALVPYVVFKQTTTKEQLGIPGLVAWSDIGLSILSVLPYYLLSAALLYVGTEVFKVIDPDVGQDIPFKNLTLQVEYAVAFLTLVVLAPLAEELVFRGYFLGKLQTRMRSWLAVIITAAVFGLMHLPGSSESGAVVLQWGAAADTFAMGLVAGCLRLISGNIWAGVLLHAFKNSIAYYFLFINPLPPA